MRQFIPIDGEESGPGCTDCTADHKQRAANLALGQYGQCEQNEQTEQYAEQTESHRRPISEQRFEIQQPYAHSLVYSSCVGIQLRKWAGRPQDEHLQRISDVPCERLGRHDEVAGGNAQPPR